MTWQMLGQYCPLSRFIQSLILLQITEWQRKFYYHWSRKNVGFSWLIILWKQQMMRYQDRERFVAYLSSETLITASSCGIVTAMLTVSLHPSSLFTKMALSCFRLEVSSSESLIVAAILRLLAQELFPSCNKTTLRPELTWHGSETVFMTSWTILRSGYGCVRASRSRLIGLK